LPVIRCSLSYPYKEVDGEEDIEDEIDLLRGTLSPFVARFHRLSARTYNSSYQQAAAD